MPVYIYRAKDGSGRQKSGTVDAKTQTSAVALLKEQGLFVVSLAEHRRPIFEKILDLGGVPDTEVAVFTRQLSTMVSSGLPISRALDVLAEQTSNKNMRMILLDVLRAVEGGSALSDAFGRFQNTFSPTYRALVKAGESSGKLDVILNRLADTLDAQRELRASFKGAMVYPAIVFTAMIAVLIIMIVFVVPRLSAMYESLNVELPAVTRYMIAMSDLLVGYWYVFLLVIFGSFAGLKLLSQSDSGRDVITRFVFAIPVFGKINRQKELTEFAGTLSLLIASAIPIVEALNIVSKVAGEPKFRDAILESARYVERGNSLSEYMKSNKVFPPLLTQMAVVGEETGQLDSVLQRVSDFFSGETSRAVKGLSAALEPIILIMLGGMVGLLMVSIITPIYKITNSIT
ncbi:type II secretion system F family protein [candidate division WWE3 bacterium]|nr:type II secretion system F family protein [candidate division WWE3 bacterium]